MLQLCYILIENDMIHNTSFSEGKRNVGVYKARSFICRVVDAEERRQTVAGGGRLPTRGHPPLPRPQASGNYQVGTSFEKNYDSKLYLVMDRTHI